MNPEAQWGSERWVYLTGQFIVDDITLWLVLGRDDSAGLDPPEIFYLTEKGTIR